MQIMMFLSDIMIPLLIFLIIGYGLLCRHNIYEEFIEGAKDGFETVIGIMPTLIGLMVAVGILRASGFLECFSNVCAIFIRSMGRIRCLGGWRRSCSEARRQFFTRCLFIS